MNKYNLLQQMRKQAYLKVKSYTQYNHKAKLKSYIGRPFLLPVKME